MDTKSKINLCVEIRIFLRSKVKVDFRGKVGINFKVKVKVNLGSTQSKLLDQNQGNLRVKVK